MPIVTNTLTDPAGRGLVNITVRITLIAPGNPFRLNGSGEVVQSVAVDTDHDGVWTAELAGNATFEQTDTYYLVDESAAPDGQKWAIRVPLDGGPYLMRDLLVYVPPEQSGTGPTTPSGTFEYVQNVASVTWTIAHRLGYRPVIEVLESLDPSADSNGLEWALRSDPDLDTTVLRWAAPLTGRALCS